jgi:hypothetical protein
MTTIIASSSSAPSTIDHCAGDFFDEGFVDDGRPSAVVSHAANPVRVDAASAMARSVRVESD